MAIYLGDLEIWLSETQVHGGYDEQVEQGRRKQASQDDDRHRVFDLLTWNIAGDHQGYQGQPGGQRSHHDRRDPLARPALDQLWTKNLAFLLLQLLKVADYHDPVGGSDPNGPQQSNHRP